jgi:hypothetical protein
VGSDSTRVPRESGLTPPVESDPTYSMRSATVGEIFVARRAGR